MCFVKCDNSPLLENFATMMQLYTTAARSSWVWSCILHCRKTLHKLFDYLCHLSKCVQAHSTFKSGTCPVCLCVTLTVVLVCSCVLLCALVRLCACMPVFAYSRVCLYGYAYMLACWYACLLVGCWFVLVCLCNPLYVSVLAHR